MTADSWLDLGTFQANNVRQWQTFETAQYWIRYMKIEIKSAYVNRDTHFVTISSIKYLLSLNYRVLGETVAQGMQHILKNNNKTKGEAFKHATKPDYTTHNFWKLPYEESMTSSSFLEIEKEIKGLVASTDVRETLLDDFVKNVSDPWPSSQEMSVYESLIEKVTNSEKYLAIIIKAFHNLRKFTEILEAELLKLIQYVFAHGRNQDQVLEELKEQLRREESEIEELKRQQRILEYNNERQEYVIAILFSLQLIMLVVVVILLYYCKSMLIKTKQNKVVLLNDHLYTRGTYRNVRDIF